MSLQDLLTSVLLLGGGMLSLTAAIGFVRLPDVAARLQAATKPQILGLLMVLAGAAPYIEGTAERVQLVLVGLFQLITAPVLGQLVTRSAHAHQNLDPNALVVDELAQRTLPEQDGPGRPGAAG